MYSYSLTRQTIWYTILIQCFEVIRIGQEHSCPPDFGGDLRKCMDKSLKWTGSATDIRESFVQPFLTSSGITYFMNNYILVRKSLFFFIILNATDPHTYYMYLKWRFFLINGLHSISSCTWFAACFQTPFGQGLPQMWFTCCGFDQTSQGLINCRCREPSIVRNSKRCFYTLCGISWKQFGIFTDFKLIMSFQTSRTHFILTADMSHTQKLWQNISIMLINLFTKVTWVAVRGEVSHFSTEVDISINCWSGPRLTLVVARWHCYRWLWLQNQFSQWSQNLTQSQTIMKTSFVLKDVPDLSLSYCKETTYSYYSTYNWKN